MPELLTFVDIQTQTTPQKINSTSGNNDSEVAPGFFDALITEYTAIEGNEIQNENLTLLSNIEEANNQILTFKGGKIFSNSVLDVIAPENPDEALNDSEDILTSLKISLGKIKDSQPEVFYEDDEIKFDEEISQLLNLTDEELKQKLESLPEDSKIEIQNLVREINNAVENGEDLATIEPAVEKLSGLLGEYKAKAKIAAPDSKIEIQNDNDDDEGQEQELEINSANVAGLAAVVNTNNSSEELGVTPEDSQPEHKQTISEETPKQAIQQQNQASPQNSKEVNNVAQKIQSENETDAKSTSNFNEELERLGAEHENQNFSGSQNEEESGNQNQNFDQAREIFSSNRNQSRSRNDNRRVTNDSRDDERRTNSTTHRTDSRNDFQSFFEGVLNSRRASSAASSEPLNLRENFGFTQSATLRNGLVNVVRFIRADGVQKASVVIDPPALGRISVELTSSSSGVEASIKVASEQIRQLVQDQLTQLRMNLSEQGVQVAEFTVDVQQDSQNGGGNSQNDNQQDGRRNFISELEEDDDTEEFRIDLEDGLLYWIA